jgi:hypothetical protein
MPYPSHGSAPGRSHARSRSSVAKQATNAANANGRASAANRVVEGSTAKTIPATSPTDGLNRRRPSKPIIAAEPTMANSDGKRSAMSEAPNAETHKCMNT